MVFEIPLAEQKVKPHQVTALHLVSGFALLAGSAIALLINNMVETLPTSAPIEVQKKLIERFDNIDMAASIIMAVSIIILISALFRNKWLRTHAVNKTYRIIELLILATVSIFLLTVEYNIPAALFGLLVGTIVFSLFWESGKNTKPLTLHFSDEGIKLPVTSRRRGLRWSDAENVILRHGTITINCTDNRMFQWVTSRYEYDVEEFENYCMAQIAAAKHKRKSEW